MSRRVVLFGATGFTGRITAEAMTRAGLAPVLAGRHPDDLVALVGDLAPLAPIDAAPTWQAADAQDPASVRDLVRDPQDVLVSTVGPFALLGRPAVEAAIDQGCAYVDSTGEPAFIRELFEQDAAPATRTGARLLPAFGYDYVPGNLAAAHAIRDARSTGDVPTIVEVGYFVRGEMMMSSGTRASLAGAALSEPFALRNGQVVGHRGSTADFEVDGRQWSGMPVGGSEHFALTRIDPDVRDVSVYLGWAGRMTGAAHIAGGVVSGAARVPLLGSALRSGAQRAVGGPTREGPSPQTRARSSTLVLARAKDGVGRVLSSVRVEGPSPYDLTADLLAWAAAMCATDRTTGTGTLGPVDAFGFDALVAGCADMGLRRVD